MRRAWLVTLFSLLCAAALAQGIRAPYQALSDSVTRRMGFSPVAGNSLQFFRSGEAFKASLLQEIGAAKESIDLEYYWLEDDAMGRPVRDALVQKAREGLRVRVVVDNRIIPLEKKSFFRTMEKAGVVFHFRQEFKDVRLWNLPEMAIGERDHRKIVVLDGRVAYTGGMNLCQESLEWDDTHLRIEGPLTVSLGALFDRTWQEVSGEVPSPRPLPDGPAPGNILAQLVHGDGDEDLEAVYLTLLGCVQRYVYLRSPYLVPPPRLLEAIQETARRGVDVRILLPQKSDWAFMNDITRYYYQSLHEAGVRLYTFAPAYDHTKSIVADDCFTCIGTVNLDNRSFYINEEDTVFFYGEDVARAALADFLDALERSQEVSAEDGRITGLRKTWINFLLSIAPIL